MARRFRVSFEIVADNSELKILSDEEIVKGFGEGLPESEALENLKIEKIDN